VVNAVLDAVRQFGVHDIGNAVFPDAGLARHPQRQGGARLIPSNFDYVAPTTVDEAVAALAEGGRTPRSSPVGRA